MNSEPISVPRPLVTANQWFILVTVMLSITTGFYFLMILPLLVGLSGLTTGVNPYLLLVKKLLRKPLSSYIQEDLAQLQFNQTIAVSCLAMALIGFYAGWTVVGYIFSIMVAIAAAVALLGFCIGCFIRFQWQQYQYRKTAKK